MAQRMAVVPPEFLLTHQFQKPDIRVEGDIMKLLDQSKLPDDMKAKLLGEMVTRFQHEVHKPKEPIKVTFSDEKDAEKKEAHESEVTTISDQELDSILISIPKKSRPYVRLIVNKLKQYNYSWNADGELKKGNFTYDDTNIIDLFSYLMRNTKDNPPYGFYEFVEALSDSKVPMRWIGNNLVKRSWFPFAKNRQDSTSSSPLKTSSSQRNLKVDEIDRGSTSKEWESY